LINNYIKSPGNKALNKSLQDLYKELNLHTLNDVDLEESANRDEIIRDFIGARDDVEPEFEYLPADTQPKQAGFMEMFKESFKTRAVASDYQPTALKKESLQTTTHTIFPTYRMVDEKVISKMGLDTVFFIFYYQKVR